VTRGASKQDLYPQLARIGQALASDKRLELIDLLAQGLRNVDSLAALTGQSVANISQHLQALRAARLVESDRRGTKVFYRLPSESVVRLWLDLRSMAEERLPEAAAIVRDFASERAGIQTISRTDMERLSAQGEGCLLDVRPSLEFESGHLAGAINIPVGELPERLGELPRDSLIVTYCRGEYCLMADEAAALLEAQGFNVARLDGGWPEWLVEGRAVAREKIAR